MARTPTTDPARHTRDRILDGALELFNRDGTAQVTTNHIAAHVGISPGNLYYWFTDKHEIIRALWARFAGDHGALWEGPEIAASTSRPGEALARLAAATRLSRTYRFLARDLLALVYADPELRALYVDTRERRLAHFGALARDWRSNGLVRAVTDERLDDLSRSLWIIAETWWPFAELGTAEPDPREGERMLQAVLEPYLTAAPSTDTP